MKISFKEWLVKNEIAGTGAIVSSCKPTADYQVLGNCSNLKPRKKIKRNKDGNS